MSRVALALSGLASLAAAILLQRSPPPAPGGALAALGRSMGGLSVLAVDALYLRSESLRRAGRTEELKAYYDAMMEFDPENAAACDALAGVYVSDLLPTAPTTSDRLGWWQEAWDLVRRGLEARPDSSRLLVRAADLLLGVPEAHPDLVGALDAAAGGASAREARGLALLAEATRVTDNVPGLGRTHFRRLARAAPLLAVRAMRRLDDLAHVQSLLAVGRTLLSERRAVLAEMFEPAPADTEASEPGRVPVDQVLEAALAAVDEALTSVSGHPALDRLVHVAGPTALGHELEAWWARR